MLNALAIAVLAHSFSQPAHAAPPPRVARVVVSGDRLVITEKIHFELDSAAIRRGSLPILDELARVLKENPRIQKVEIGGHTDSRGDAAYNRALSQRRSEEVARYLVTRHGIARQRLVARGYGESHLIAHGDSERAHAANRRVEFRVLKRV